MSANRSVAIGKLVRWRAFQEAIAERAYQQASAQALEAQRATESAQAAADAIVQRRDALLAERAIDLALLQAIGDFEMQAAEFVRQRRDAQREAERVRDDALAAHLEARARTRVAETRFDEVAAQERDQEEKRMFDRMASLLVAAGGGSSHD